MCAVAILPAVHAAGKYSAVCVRPSVRARVRVRVCACAHVCVLANGGGTGTRCTAATGGIYSSACNGRADTCAFCVGHSAVRSRGRRCQLDTRDREIAVGCPSFPHDRDQRHRRHLRHRRRWRRQHQLQRRLGEQRRRCGPDSRRGYSTGTCGYSRGTLWYTGVLHGTLGVLKGYCPGTSGLLEEYSDGA
jgi:hypothetical protein